MVDVMTGDGDCFVVAFHGAEFYGDAVLCHGTVDHPEVGLHSHAWIERTIVLDFPLPDGGTTRAKYVVAIDKSNGNDIELPAAFYRKLGDAHDVAEYTWDEAAKAALKSGHYGPWSS